jgi:hypothetical protein
MELAWVDVLGGEVYVIHMVVLVGRERVDLWAGKRGVLWRSVKDDEVVPRRYVQDSSIVLSSLVPELMIILLLPTRRLRECEEYSSFAAWSTSTCRQRNLRARQSIMSAPRAKHP